MPILGGDGVTVTGLAVLAEPLTAVRQAEAATAASERRLRLAYDAAELGSWHWDMATGIVVWDERLEAIFGLNARWLRRHLRDLARDDPSRGP